MLSLPEISFDQWTEICQHWQECPSCAHNAICRQLTYDCLTTPGTVQPDLPAGVRDWEILLSWLFLHKYMASIVRSKKEIRIADCCTHISFGVHAQPCKFLICPFDMSGQDDLQVCIPQVDTVTWLLNERRKLRESGQQGIFPLLKLPGELRNSIYRFALVAEDYPVDDIQRSRDARALLHSNRQVWQETTKVFSSEARLSLDLTDNLVRKANEPTCYIDALCHKSIPTSHVAKWSWFQTFSKYKWTAHRPSPQNPTHWQRFFYNLSIATKLANLRSSPAPITFLINIGSIGGEIIDDMSLINTSLTSPGLQHAMLNFRSWKAQLSLLEDMLTETSPIVATDPVQKLREVYQTPEELELYYQFEVMAALGNLARRRGKEIRLCDSTRRRKLVWKIPEEEVCGIRGADVKELYLLTNWLHDDGTGLWLECE